MKSWLASTTLQGQGAMVWKGEQRKQGESYEMNDGNFGNGEKRKGLIGTQKKKSTSNVRSIGKKRRHIPLSMLPLVFTTIFGSRAN